MKNLLSMKTPVLALFISLVAFGACVSNKQTQPSTDYTQLVNPFIGTDFTGNTYPGAQAPFGMVQLSPDNGLPGWDRISGYFYPDSTIAGFSHTHLSGTGAGDLYDISFMPVTLPYQEAEAPLGIYSKFSHADEEASAGYYRVLLKDYDINVELTATERCGIQRYTFPEGESAVFLNLKKAMNWDFTNDSYIEIIDSCTIQGYRFSEGWARGQHVYFRTRFSKPFASVEMDTTAIALKGKRVGTAYIARFNFDTEKGEQIVLSTALSGVSMEGAAKNMAAEAPHNDHADEEASAGYYRVLLKDYDINVELTATERCGIQRYTFPEGESAVFLNLKKAMNWDFTNDSYIEIIDSCTIQGYRFSEGWARGQHVYFRTRFSKPFASVEMDTTAIALKGKRVGTAYIARFNFDTEKGEQIVLSTALSGVSMEGAAKNMAAEAPHNDFDKYLAETKDNWNRQLGKIEVTGDNKDDKVNFYTALYHTMIAPTIYSDVDGAYYGPDKKIHQTDGWVNYGTFSLWDTYRAAHPLFTYTEPQRVNDMVKSFIAFYEQNGRLPVWNFWGSETDMMIGYHAVPVIVDAYLKGIGDFDAEKALEACVATANLDDYRGIGLYKKLGYIPYNIKDEYNAENWSLSKTLEYAFDDYCIAEMARKMGRTQLADEFYKRSQNYRNVFNPASSFMQPIDDKGVFQPNFSPDDYTAHICESNGWQYFWSVQQDIKGLIALTGGKDRFTEKLDSMFTYIPAGNADLPLFSTGMIGQYAHGNEPSHHVIYLYNKVRQPWKTQKYAAQVMHDLYFNAPAGLCGNEDCGQMSAWYVFSAMGFYPVNPVSGEYEIGTPLFPEIQMHLDNGKTFTVLAPGVSRENIYIQSVKVNGQPYDKSYITHRQIMDGATVEFEMGPEPGNIWYR
jgi:predicted alpha-1,2-mannosidase